MSLIINSKVIKLIWWLVAPFAVAKLITLSVLFYFDKDISSYDKNFNERAAKKEIFRVPKFFPNQKTLYDIAKNTHTGENIDFKDLELKACYIEPDRAFVIISYKKESVFLDLNDSYKGIKLVEVNLDSAKFLKNGVEKVLKIMESKNSSEDRRNGKKLFDSDDEKEYVTFSRKDFTHYLKKPMLALRDIRFNEIKNGKKFDGIKLNFVRKNSVFYKMGLKKGDIIKSVEGKKLNSIMDLLPYYNNIQNMTTLTVGVDRNGEMKEFIYEIN